MKLQGVRELRVCVGVAVLLIIMAAQLVMSVRRESQAWDEGVHLFAGYSYWKHADFGRNPEHPPLVKLLAALPLLGMNFVQPRDQNRPFKIEGFLEGRDFLYSNNAERMLFRGRLVTALLTLALAFVVFLAAKEMFGTEAGFIALLLAIFEPNILAHGALVTTHIAASLFIFVTVYLFYRYAKSPTWPRLLVVGLAAGLALAAKHSGVLVFPMLLLLAFCEALRRKAADCENTQIGRFAAFARRLQMCDTSRYIGALALIGVMALAVLWAFYGFRYAARPAGLQMNPPLADAIRALPVGEARIFAVPARFHALPEAYIYGLLDVRNLSQYIRSYVFGHVYPRGVWFYFPAAFVVKSTLAFLIFIAIAKFAIITRRFTRWREILYLTIPACLYLLVAMASGLNLGIRHILSVYVFLAALIAGAASSLIERNRHFACLVTALLIFHAASTLRAFPNYIAYSNEAFGGTAHTYKYLSDSNVDWGQQLKSVKRYVDQHDIRDCWFAYFAQTAIEPSAYGIPCKPLPVISSQWLGEHLEVPPTINGPVFISAGILSGYTTGDGELNPYDVFRRTRPLAQVDGGVFVYDGHFDVSLASAIAQTDSAYEALKAHDFDRALADAQSAVRLAPRDSGSRLCLGVVLSSLNRPDEARREYEEGLRLAKSVQPDFQAGLIWLLQQKLDGK